MALEKSIIDAGRGVAYFDTVDPTDGTSGTGAGEARAGTLYTNTDTGQVFVNTGTLASPEWIPEFANAPESGLGDIRCARAIFDPSATAAQCAQAAHGLGVTIPDNAIVCGGFMQVITAITGVGASVAIMIQGANDIQTAAAISGAPWSTTGLKAIVPKANTPESTGIALTAAREITATVTGADLTAGKVVINLYYVMGA